MSQSASGYQNIDDTLDDISHELDALNEGLGRLKTGDNLDAGDIFYYASEKRNYNADRRSARRAGQAQAEQQIKDLTQRQQEAAAHGDTFTGLIRQFNVGKGKDTLVNTSFYQKGVQVSPDQFLESSSVYTKNTGALIVLPKGVQVSSLSEDQKRQIFPEEYERAAEIARLQANLEQQQELKRVAGLQLTPTQLPTQAPKPFYKKAWSGVKTVFGVSADALGSIVPDTSLSGTQSLQETTLSESELKARRGTILADFFKSVPLFSVSGGGAATGFGGGSGGAPAGLANLESFNLRRDIATGSDTAKTIQEKRALQVVDIEKSVTQLNDINLGVNTLNEEIKKNPTVTPEKAQDLAARYNVLREQRFQVYEQLAGKGVQTKIAVDAEGNQKISFTSPELEQDLASSAVKEFRGKTKLQQGVAIADVVVQEIGEGAALGYALGITGTVAKVGTQVARLPLVSRLVTKYPTAVKIGAVLVGGTAVGITTGASAYRTGKEFEQEGLNPLSGYLLGGGIPLGKAIGITVGVGFGNRLYTQRIIESASKGGYTKPLTQEQEINGKKIKVPQQVRYGETREINGGGAETAVRQRSALETRIPDTDIVIKQVEDIQGKYGDQSPLKEGGDVIAKVTRGKAPIGKGGITRSRILFLEEPNTQQTGIVVLSKTPKGVTIDQYRTKANLEDFRVLKETPDGTQTALLTFKRPIVKVGDSIFVKGAGTSKAYLDTFTIDDLRRSIDFNRLFVPFAGEDKLYSVSRAQQIVELYPKQIAGVNAQGDVLTVQRFASIGSSRTARVDALATLIRTNARSGRVAVIGDLISNKKGQLYLPNAPSTLYPAPASSTPDFASISNLVYRQQDFTSLQLPSLIKELAPSIAGDIATRTGVGTDLLLASGVNIALEQKGRQRSLQAQVLRMTQFDIQTPIQKNVPAHRQEPSSATRLIQQQAQLLQQALIQQPELEFTPNVPFTNTPMVPTPPPTMYFGDANLAKIIGKKVRAKGRGRVTSEYTPDFTAKILDLPPLELNQKQAMRLINKVQTGFELRRSVRIKY